MKRDAVFCVCRIYGMFKRKINAIDYCISAASAISACAKRVWQRETRLLHDHRYCYVYSVKVIICDKIGDRYILHGPGSQDHVFYCYSYIEMLIFSGMVMMLLFTYSEARGDFNYQYCVIGAGPSGNN